MDPSFPVDGPTARLKDLGGYQYLGGGTSITLVNGEHTEGGMAAQATGGSGGTSCGGRGQS